MNNSVELRAARASIEFEARSRLDTAEGATPERAAEIETEVNKMLADADKLEARAKLYDDLEARSKALEETDNRRPAQTRSTSSDSAEEKRSRDFAAYLRGDISERELRSMNVATDAKGGFTAPSSTQSEVQVALGEQGPMVDSANVFVLSTDNGNEILYNSLDDRARKAYIIAEGAEANETDVTLTQRALGAFKYTSGKVLISNELLQDSNTNIIQLVTRALTAGMDRALNAHFTTGTGSGQPRGIVTAVAADSTKLITTVGALAVGPTADELFKLAHKVAPAYRPAAKFMFSDDMLFHIRTLKDANGNYIWRPGLADGAVDTVLGKPYVINPDMTYEAGGVAALYGNLKDYTFRQVRDFSIKRSDELAMTSDQVVFVGFGRYDGDLTNPWGVAGLKIKTA